MTRLSHVQVPTEALSLTSEFLRIFFDDNHCYKFSSFFFSCHKILMPLHFSTINSECF